MTDDPTIRDESDDSDEDEPAYCQQCGDPITGSDQFCAGCGEPPGDKHDHSKEE